MKRLTDVYGNVGLTLTLASICHNVHAMPDCTIAPVLLQGEYGTGKSALAWLLAAGVNCKDSVSGPCGTCANCIATQEDRHPAVMSYYAPDVTPEDYKRLYTWTMGKTPLWRVLIFEDVERLSLVQVHALSQLMDARLPRTLVVMTSHTYPDTALLSHTVALTTASLDEVQTRTLADAVSEREEPVPAELLEGTHGVPRAVIAAATLWGNGAEVSERVDYTEKMLRGALMGNMAGGLTAVEEHLKQGGTYAEAVTGWVRAVTEILTGRVTGAVPAQYADLSDWLNEPRALAVLRLVNEKGGLTFVHDPSTRLRALYALLCHAVDPSLFEVISETKSESESTPVHVSEPETSIEDLGTEFFGK